MAPADFLNRPAGKVFYLPVVLRGAVIGFLWSSEDDTAVGFYPNKGARHRDTARAAAIWSNRLRNGRAEGLTPSHILYRWTGKPEHAEAGAVAMELSQQHGDVDEMVRNHGAYQPPVKRRPPPWEWMATPPEV